MKKKDIIKLTGVTYNQFMHYQRNNIIEGWPDDIKNSNEDKINNYVTRCKNDIRYYKRHPILRPHRLKEDFNLPEIYLFAQKLRGY